MRKAPGSAGRGPWPDCGSYFVPKFELLCWPEGCPPHQALKETRLACPECGAEIEQRHRKLLGVRAVLTLGDLGAAGKGIHGSASE